MSSPPPNPSTTTDEERKRRSTRLALAILGFSGGCGCLILVGAFLFGVILGAVDKGMRRPIPIATPVEEEPLELRLPQ